MSRRAGLPAAVVFDLDGTLIDSLPDVIAALNRLLAEEGRRPVTIYEGRHMIGEGAAPLVSRALAVTGTQSTDEDLAALVERYLVHYRAVPVELTTVYPGVVEVLDGLRDANVAMGVCTNKPDGMSRIVLASLGLDAHFASVIGGDVLPVKKPDAGHVFAVLEEMDAAAGGAVFVGDSPTDMATARNAGLASIAVSYGYSGVPAAELDADVLIDRFSALPDALVALSNNHQSSE